MQWNFLHFLLSKVRNCQVVLSRIPKQNTLQCEKLQIKRVWGTLPQTLFRATWQI